MWIKVDMFQLNFEKSLAKIIISLRILVHRRFEKNNFGSARIRTRAVKRAKTKLYQYTRSADVYWTKKWLIFEATDTMYIMKVIVEL